MCRGYALSPLIDLLLLVKRPKTNHGAAFGLAALAAAAMTLVLFPIVAHAGSCGMGNACAVVDSLTVSSSPVPLGSVVNINCATHDDRLITRVDLTVQAGVFSNGTTSITITPALPAPSIQVSVPWSVPANIGIYTATCTPWDNGGFAPKPIKGFASNLLLDVQNVALPPVINSFVAEASSSLPGQPIRIVAAASDPSGGLLRWSWSSTAGSISGDTDSDPASIIWTAPDTIGNTTITATVTNPLGQQASASLTIKTVWAIPASQTFSLDSGLFYPERVAVDTAGFVYVTDPRAGNIQVFTPKGDPLRTMNVNGTPSGIAVDAAGTLYVGNRTNGSVAVIKTDGTTTLLGTGAGEFQRPVDIAIDGFHGLIVVADARAEEIRSYRLNGSHKSTLPLSGISPSSVAVDNATGKIYIADARHGKILVYRGSDLVQTIGSFGSGAGELSRVGGITLDSRGYLYAIDSFQGRIVVYDNSGKFVSFIGTYGEGMGELRIPVDVAATNDGRIIVTSTNNGRLEVFEQNVLGEPSCPGDSDCDGMPDAWEIANGTNPNDPTDAYLDSDGDGLLNIEEFRAGSNPFNKDSDGDGIPDGVEVATGLDPASASDNLPFANAGFDLTIDPTLLTLNGSLSTDPNGDLLSFLWTQIGGPETVRLRAADSSTPWAVLRKAGEYTFQLLAGDGIASVASKVKIDVANVAPSADAGPDIVTTTGRRINLDGSFSRDANGDTLHYAWSIVAGPVFTRTSATTAKPGLAPSNVAMIPSRALLAATTGKTSFVPQKAGVYSVVLKATDQAGLSSTDTLEVTVNAPEDHVPQALANTVVRGQIDQTIILDGSASFDADGDSLTWLWQQTDGPVATLHNAQTPKASFVPKHPGLYRFTLTVNDSLHNSLPARVTVIVGSTNNSAPIAEAGADRRVQVLQSVRLNCGLSSDPDGSSIACQWHQLSGVHVPLQNLGTTARFVPIESGTYVFEVTVADESGLSDTDRVTVVADDPARNFVPVAVADISGLLEMGHTVTLSASRSSDADSNQQLHYLWNQVAGPQAVLSYRNGVSTTLRPSVPGNYAFELRVDDGINRSPAALVQFPVGTHINKPPVAEAGPDMLITPTVRSALSGNNSHDPEGHPLTFRWRRVEGPADVALLGTNTPALQIRPDQTGYTLQFELTVNDGTLDSVPDSVNVSVVDFPIGLYPVNSGGAFLSVDNSESIYNGMTLDIPAGALAGDVQVALGEVAIAYSGSKDTALNRALFVGPSGQQFSLPVEIRIPLDPAQLQASGIENKNVKLMQYDQANHHWVEVPDYQVDSAAGIISFHTTSANIFQITIPAVRAAQPASESSFGCSATTGSSSPDGSFFLLLLLALAMLCRDWKSSWKKVGSLLLFLLIALGLVMVSDTAYATDAPHDLTRLTNGCQDCHMLHNAPGNTLTNVIGNANLCMSCHALQGMNWVNSDQAIPGVIGSSHRWDATVTNPTFGASMPTDREMKIRLDKGKIICSTCHQQHRQTLMPADARAPTTPGAAGRHFQRVNNYADQMCLNCHSVRNIQSVKDGSWTGANLSHPVQVPLKGSCGIGAQGSDCATCVSGFSGPGCTANPCVADGLACGYGLCTLSGPGCTVSTCGIGKSHDDTNPAICNTDATCPSASCVNAETCSLSPIDSDLVCTCPVGYDAATCSTCRTGFSGPGCSTTVCASVGQACGSGTCLNLPADCTISDCQVNEHNNDSTGACIADTACSGASCSGVVGTCKATPNTDETYCDCPMGYNGPDCASCSAGFSGATCTADTCTLVGQACGYGTCASTPGTGNEQQSCSDTPDAVNFGAGLACESSTCLSEEAGAAGAQAIGGDCYSSAVYGDGTLVTTMSYVFNTSNPDNTNFYIWMRNTMDQSYETGEQHDCTLTGVYDGTSAGTTLAFSFTENGTSNGWYGANCATEYGGAGWPGYVSFYCWMALNTSGAARSTPMAVALNNGTHTLNCTITVNNAEGGSEDAGYDGFLFTTNSTLIPTNSDGPTACVDVDATFSGGICSGVNWGPNVQPPPGPLVCAACATGYTGASCDTCDAGYTLQNGICVNTDPCSGVTCQNGGTCYVDSNNTAVCDCTGQYFGQTPGSYCTSCTATAGLKCRNCAVGYIGPSCDTCAAGYVKSGGACIADPCVGVTCQNGGSCFVSSAGTATCDCPGQFYGSLCQNCDNPAIALCGCQTGYTGANCDQCDTSAGYFSFNGRCVLNDPCQAGNCTRMSFYTPPKDFNGNPQLEVLTGTATGGNTTSLLDSSQNWSNLTGKYVRFTSGANNSLTRVISSSTATQINFAAVPAAIVVGDSYEIDSDGNLTNNFLLSSGSKGSYTSGNVECTSCHGPHYADSNASTYDDRPRPGDGNLLRRGNDDSACTGCHAEKLHNSTNTSSQYGTWGASFTCQTCHSPHNTKNIYLIKEIIQTPNSGLRPVDFRAMTISVGPNSLVDTANPGFGPCEVCHTQTKNADNSARYRNSAPFGDQGKHYTQRCEGCHDHKDGFRAGESDGGAECWGCHWDIWTRMNGQVSTTQGGQAIVTRHAIGTVKEYNDSPDQAFPNITWANNLGSEPVTDRSCTNMCHTDHVHNIASNHSKTVHDDASNSATRIKADEVSTDFDSATNAGLCISCHDQQVDANRPPINGAAYNASAHDFTTAAGNTWEYQHHDGSKFQRNCTKCHADRDDTMPNKLSDKNNPTASVHYSRDPSLLAGDTNPNGTVNEFICYNCHGNGTNGTVDRSGKNIYSQVSKTSGHPSNNDAVHNTVAEDTNAAFGNSLGGASRHASCMDCHETHKTKAGTHATPGNKAGPPLQGAWGAELSTYPARWAAPTAANFTKKPIVAGTDLEATLCFKCHSSYYGALPSSPSGGFVETDTAREFNPNNTGNGAGGTNVGASTAGSFHPVLANAGSNLGRINPANLVTTNFPWNTGANTNLMTCSDCHESDNTADPNGPHGSTAGFILRGPNTKWDGTIGAIRNSGMPNGTFCANCHSQTFANSRWRRTGRTQSLHTYRDHTIWYSTKCWNCHNRIPHGNARPGFLVVTSPEGGDTMRYTDNAPYRSLPTGQDGLRILAYPANGTALWNSTSMCACGNRNWSH